MVENVADDLADSLRGYDRSPEATASPHLWRGALPTDLAVGGHKVEYAPQPDGAVFCHHPPQPADGPALTRRKALQRKDRMDIRFMAGTTPVTLNRHWFTGAMLLQSATEGLGAASAASGHLLTSRWYSRGCAIAGHEVLVERTRPLLFAGARSGCVLVDGVQVASRKACRPA